MQWCENNGVDYVFGLPGSKPLSRAVDDKADEIRVERALAAAFAALSPQDRMKWIAMRFGPFPRDMLMPKALYLESGGLDHSLARFEDWDLKLRLAGLADWVGTQRIGIRYRRHGSGLSNVDRFDLLHAQTVVLMRNRRGIEAAVNPSFFEKAFVARWLDVFSVASGGLIP